MSDTTPPDDGDGDGPARRSAASSPSRSRRRWSAPSSTTPCRSSSSRALPDARDGLKPVHRRILWGMHELGRSPRPPHHEVRPRHRRRHGQVPPPRRRRDLRRAGAHGPGLLSLRHPLVARPRQLRLARRSARPPPATPSAGWPRIAMHMLDGIDEDTVDFNDNYSGEVQEPDGAAGRGSRTCWSTAARASPSAWPPTSRPTTWARSSTPPSHLLDQPRGHARRPHAVRQGPRLPDRRR